MQFNIWYQNLNRLTELLQQNTRATFFNFCFFHQNLFFMVRSNFLFSVEVKCSARACHAEKDFQIKYYLEFDSEAGGALLPDNSYSCSALLSPCWLRETYLS